MPEYDEIYNSIITGFQLSDYNLKQTSFTVETLAKARMEICKLLKIKEFSDETLYENEKRFLANIDINKLNIKEYEKKQVELKDKINIKKQEIKTLKHNINTVEHKLAQEKQESRKFREALRIFLSREKFKILKRILISRYRKVFLKYSSESSIKIKILECNGRKEEMRDEKQDFNNSLDICNKRIILAKRSLAETRKNIINTEKSSRFIMIKLKKIEDYKKTEKKFRLEIKKCKE